MVFAARLPPRPFRFLAAADKSATPARSATPERRSPHAVLRPFFWKPVPLRVSIRRPRKEPAIRSWHGDGRRRTNGCGFTSAFGPATSLVFRSDPEGTVIPMEHVSGALMGTALLKDRPFSPRGQRQAGRSHLPRSVGEERQNAIAAISTTTASASGRFCKNSPRASSTASISRDSANCTNAIKRRSF